jgi:hypothetical protein
MEVRIYLSKIVSPLYVTISHNHSLTFTNEIKVILSSLSSVEILMRTSEHEIHRSSVRNPIWLNRLQQLWKWMFRGKPEVARGGSIRRGRYFCSCTRRVCSWLAYARRIRIEKSRFYNLADEKNASCHFERPGFKAVGPAHSLSIA